jgi:hypothetical protein
MIDLASVIAACERSRSQRARRTDPWCSSAIATSVGWPSTLMILKRPSPPVERVGGDGRFRLVLSLPSTGVF